MLFLVQVKYKAKISLKMAKMCYTILMYMRLGMSDRKFNFFQILLQVNFL